MYSQNNKIILHASCKPQVLFDFVFSDISLMSNCVVSSNTKLLHFFYEARVRFGTRVRVWVRVRVQVQDSAIFEKVGCGCSGTRRLKNY